MAERQALSGWLVVLGVFAVMVIIGSLSRRDTYTWKRTEPSADTSATSSYGPGADEVFREIASETDCAELQGAFDRAYETIRRPGTVPDSAAFDGARGKRWSQVGNAYMAAADDRMRDIGCYE